jgi:hypothetical protein
MSQQIDRDGIFKMIPTEWRVKTFEGKNSIAVAITFVVTWQYQDGEWIDWREFDVMAYGDYWVIKANGTPNENTVTQLVECLGWSGQLMDIVHKKPPETEVQVTVKEETYKGKTSYRCEWMNPADYTPTPKGADESAVKHLDARFGSLLRAAASGAKKAAPPKAKAPPPAPAAPPAAEVDHGDIPF